MRYVIGQTWDGAFPLDPELPCRCDLSRVAELPGTCSAVHLEVAHLEWKECDSSSHLATIFSLFLGIRWGYISTHFLCGADMQEENNINFCTLIYRDIPVTMLYEHQYIPDVYRYIYIYFGSEALHTYTLITDAAQNDVGKSPAKRG